ncbi:hypothetical protein HPP92_010751 [Vanilla planifolia]|uniref:Uncharacterized protein n=1 Tax=Vanilla planifolia TaxID=51239 RepID=A0A835RB33_VANPL|nr:hypothetical protein HPP92_010751 [Vanilla planifolia]
MKRPSDIRALQSSPSQSEESALDMDKSICGHPNLPSCTQSTLQPYASGGQHSENNAAYFSWPTSTLMHDSAEGRANYFGIFRKVSCLVQPRDSNRFPIRQGRLTDIPAILVFVARKVHRKWLNQIQCLPAALEGPGGVWCDVDVVEFSYYGAPAPTPKEQLYTELVDGLRGSYPCIGSGSQVASQETYGTLGAIVKKSN